MNKKAIEILSEDSFLTVEAIAESTGLKLGTVRNLLAALREEGKLETESFRHAGERLRQAHRIRG